MRPSYEELLENGARHTLKHGSALPVWREEATRARSEEARLLEENRKQAEQITALADALEKQRGHMGRHAFGCKQCFDVDAALRLAGRL